MNDDIIGPIGGQKDSACSSTNFERMVDNTVTSIGDLESESKYNPPTSKERIEFATQMDDIAERIPTSNGLVD